MDLLFGILNLDHWDLFDFWYLVLVILMAPSDRQLLQTLPTTFLDIVNLCAKAARHQRLSSKRW
jgi:hypothetical protein